MTLVVQSSKKPTEILLSLSGITDSKTAGLRFAVAYVTLSGCKVLIPSLIAHIGEQRWSEIPKQLITCLDYGATEPDALHLLRENGFEVSLANVRIVQDQPVPFSGSNFHSKVFLVDKDDCSMALVGSANITASALTSNSEAAYLKLLDVANDPWAAMKKETVLLTDELLSAYEANRKMVSPMTKMEGPAHNLAAKAKAQTAQGNQELQILYEAVQSGQCNPSSSQHFWVQAGSMSSGGSHNQLELPRMSNRFFGFNFVQYDNGHHTIGNPTLMKPGMEWSKPLMWHGKNGMERLNLPTQTQGGFEYRNTAVLFTRNSSGTFRLRVAPWESPEAISWKAASDSLHLTYRLGSHATSRQCGLF